jgi:hypothetical protein
MTYPFPALAAACFSAKRRLLVVGDFRRDFFCLSFHFLPLELAGNVEKGWASPLHVALLFYKEY